MTESVLDHIDGSVDLFFLCNPNNPTGRFCLPELLDEIVFACEKTGTLLAVDECFLDLTGKGRGALSLVLHSIETW